MGILSRIEALESSKKEAIKAAFESAAATDSADEADQNARMDANEKLADLLHEAGLLVDSREYYRRLIENSASAFDKSRLLRKTAASFTAQRDFLNAYRTSEEALSLLRGADQRRISVSQLFETLSTCAFACYFFNTMDRLQEIFKEMKALFPQVQDKEVQLGYYYVVVLATLRRHRWYMLPEESVTHCFYYVQLAHQTKDHIAIGRAYSMSGFVHLWREEYEEARADFEQALAHLQNRHPDFVVTAESYATVSYRMQRRVAKVEHWAIISLEEALKSDNKQYIGMAYGNMAWVHVMRGNWLYAEEYARNGIDAFPNYPMIYLCIFPLLACLGKSGQYEEAGSYCYLLLHPVYKEFPARLNESIRRMNAAWISNETATLGECLEEVITEAKLSNYF